MKRLVAAIIIALFFVVPAWAQLPGGSTIVGGSTPITGTCPTGYFLYNALGVVGCQAGGSGGSYLAGTGLTLTGSTFSLNTPTATTIGGVESITSLAHNWIGYIDTSGVPHQSQPAIADISGWGANVATALGQTLNGTGAITATDSPTFTTKETTPSLSLAGNISAPAWTTNGIRLVGVPATLTDTSSSGTVAAAYTDVLGGNTIAASSATTYTDYYSMFIKSPVAGTNATFTRSWSLGLQGNLQAAGAALGGATLGSNALAVTGNILSSNNYYSFSSSYGMGYNSAAGGVLTFFGGGGNPSIGVSYNGFTTFVPIGFSSSWANVADTVINRDAAGILAQRNGANAQSFRVANTWSSVGANYEYGVFDWQIASNVLTIGATAGGTGTLRGVNIVGASLSINGTPGVTASGATSCTIKAIANGLVTSATCI